MTADALEAMHDCSTQKIEGCLKDGKLRMTANAFVRAGKLGAENIVKILLHRVYNPLQQTIDDYFKRIKAKPVSKQAFSKARTNLNPEFIRSFFDDTAQIAASSPDIVTYKGMRLIAIDGTDLALENSRELKEAFGCSGPKKDAATALASIAYDPNNKIIYDCRIERYEKDERELAKAHINRLLEMGLGGSLLLFDRGYPAVEFLSYAMDKGFSFVARVRRKWNLEADAIERQGWIELKYEDKKYKVRVLKVMLETGERETLLTNLNQKELPLGEAGFLYFKRWGVETAFDDLKSKLQMENFSGKTKVAVEQDFYATVYILNMSNAHALVADERVSRRDEGKKLKHPRRSNKNRVICKWRERFLDIVEEGDGEQRCKMLEELIEEIARYPIAIVSGKKVPRKAPRKKRFYMARKAIV